MPEHVHLLLTPKDIPLERAVGFIKGGFSHRLHSKAPVWQRGFTDRRARNREEFLSFRQYIHRNPVEAHLCERVEDLPVVLSVEWVAKGCRRLERQNPVTSGAKALWDFEWLPAWLKPCPYETSAFPQSSLCRKDIRQQKRLQF